VCLWVRLDEGYEPIAGVVNDTAYALFTAAVAVLVIML